LKNRLSRNAVVDQAKLLISLVFAASDHRFLSCICCLAEGKTDRFQPSKVGEAWARRGYGVTYIQHRTQIRKNNVAFTISYTPTPTRSYPIFTAFTTTINKNITPA
jgi:hypothetical protein